jgi:hypothetical protein
LSVVGSQAITGGIIALAYPIDNAHGSGTVPARLHGLYRTLNYEGGLVVITDHMLDGHGYPSLWVVDGRDPDLIFHERHTDGALLYDWHDLSCLLRVDIPWWPRSLRDEAAMLSWRPGAPAATVSPRTAGADPRAITNVIDESTPPTVREALEQRAAYVAHSPTGDMDFAEAPGFVYGPRSSVDDTSPAHCR